MADDDKDLGGAPGGNWAPLPPTGGPSIEEEERAFHKGRWRMITAMIGSVVIAIAALAWFMQSGAPSPYATVGSQLNGMRQQHFDMFWACALPREDIRSITGNEQLRDAITRFARSGRAYARIVRNDCLVHLDEHGPALDALIVPEDMTAGRDELRTALGSLRTAVVAFLDHLDTLEGGFNPDENDESRRLLTAVLRGWFDYRVAIGHLNDTVRSHEEPD